MQTLEHGARRAHDAWRDAAGGGSAQQAWPTVAVLVVSFVALLLLAAACAAFIVGRWGAADELRRAEQGLAARASLDAAAIADHVDERMNLLAAIAAHPQWRAALGDAAARPGVVAAIRAIWPAAPAVAWIDERGKVVVGGGSLREGDDAAGSRWFDAASRGPMLSDESGALRAVVPLHDATRRTAGVLVADIDCDALARRVGPSDEQAASWALVGRHGQVLCRHREFEPSWVLALPSGGVQWLPGERSVLLAARPVAAAQTSQAVGWRLARAQSELAALPLARERMPRMLAAGGLVGLLALPLVWLLAQRLARPLRELAQALDQAREQFEYDPRRIPVHGTREARAVGQAARAMLGQIVAQQALVDDGAAGYRELFELHPLPMWVVDDESLRFLEVNHAAQRKYGWRRDEFISMTLPDVHPPEARPAVIATVAATRDAEHHAAVWQHRLQSGQMIDVEVASRQLRWGGRAARIAAMMDVTVQRSASLELHRQRRELSGLARQLMTTEEAERRRLAQVLHDRFTPALYGMKLSIEALRARLGAQQQPQPSAAEVAHALAPLVQGLDGAIADTRDLMSDLRPPLLVEKGLAAALAHEVQRQRRNGPPALVFAHHGAATPALAQRDLALEFAVFMIGQAALNNALQHAQARQVAIDLVESPGRLQLSVRDDGCGFDAAAPPPPGHLGLVGMQERARWIGAALSIDSVTGIGTSISLLWHARSAASSGA